MNEVLEAKAPVDRSTRLPNAVLAVAILLIATVGAIHSQANRSPIAVDSAGLEELLILDRGWVYKEGNDPAWADPAYDDSSWQPVAASDRLRRGGDAIVWFRLRLPVAEDARGRRVSLSVELRGSAEVFVDGELVRSVGTLSPATLSPATLSPVAGRRTASLMEGRIGALELPMSEITVVAVRFSSAMPGGLDWAEPGYGFRLCLGDEASTSRRAASMARLLGGHQMTFLGAFVGQAVLHFLLFLFYPRIRSNGYFAITSLLSAALAGLFFERTLSQDPRFIAQSQQLFNFLLLLTMLGLMQFVYEVFDKKRAYVFYGLVGLAALLTIWLAVNPRLDAFSDFWGFHLLVMADTARVTAGAIRRQWRGAWILAVALGSLTVGLTWQLLTVLGYLSSPFIVFPVSFYGVAGLLFWVSVFLAYQWARMGRVLRERLEQVEELSEKTLQQELEAKELEVERRLLEAENLRKSEELEAARELQLSLLPATVPELPDLEIAVSMQTATEVGGDFYDFRVDEEFGLTTTLGDATGHGARAGAMVWLMKGLFSAFGDRRDIPRFFSESSSRLRAMNLDGTNIAMAITRIKNGRLTHTSAGMPPPLIHRADQDEVEELAVQGMPLGGIADYGYREVEAELTVGDTVLLMSDGLPELVGDDGDSLGYDKTRELFREVGGSGVEEVVEQLNRAAREWGSGRPFPDDVTFVAIQVVSA